MVALLHPAHLPTVEASPRPARHLRLVEAPTKTAADPLSIVVVAGVMLMVVLVVLVRGVQGAPPAADWQALSAASAPAAVSSLDSSVTVTVVEGDTWASIADRVAPGHDPVDVARLLASANTGYRLEVGQVLTVPTLD